MTFKSFRMLGRWHWLVVAGLVSLLALPLAGWLTLRGSLPRLDGSQPIPGLSAATVVERDAQGVPTVHATNREDAARALGYLHAQDRFFEMDLVRRQSAGELAELFGAAAVPMDREARRHRFRHRASLLVSQLDPASLRLLNAYTTGVNAGIHALGARPWEYLVLRQIPRPWTPEDTICAIQTMSLSLQEHDGLDERSRRALRQVYGPEVQEFLQPTMSENSAALDGSFTAAPPVPEAARFVPRPGLPPVASAAPFAPPTATDAAWFLPGLDPEAVVGSNHFALAGTRTAGGGALVANDMHLGLAVPHIWYRASLMLPNRRMTGVSYPGVPGIITGSNGDIAWGFTDAYLDASDAVIIEPDPNDPARYRVPDGTGWEPFERSRESIRVAGGAAEILEVVGTRWGPLLTAPPTKGNAAPVLALRWLAHDSDAINLGLIELSEARSVDEAIAIAHRTGLPAENLIVGDRAGNIAWTIIGRIPKRVGFDGTQPESWADGSRRWEGVVAPDDVPVVRNPPDGQLWTANNRVVGGEAMALLGNGGYDESARAAQIRDDLTALANHAASPADGLRIELDDESRFLARWRGLLMEAVNDEAVKADPSLAELRRVVSAWHGHASINEAGYPLVRHFRQSVLEAVMNPIYEPVRRYDPSLEISRTRFKNSEQPLWSIVTQRPAWLLPSAEPSWDALLRHAAHRTAQVGRRSPDGSALADCTWGKVNTLRMQHPFSRMLPEFLAKWLDMPKRPLPGDINMPRVQGASFGASERMVVSPGRESEGIFHQPGGASGHPLSPFYRAGHDDWAEGRPSAFLPGVAKHRLVLRPGG